MRKTQVKNFKIDKVTEGTPSVSLMEQQERTENTTIGLHRPFNMPLKSLVWVCRFAKNYKQKKSHDFYMDFFLWMLEGLCNYADYFDEQEAEGIIRPQNAQNILCLFAYYNYDEIKALVRSTLSYRPQEDDKLIYSSYKNTSYYITLAKKVKLINNRGELTSLGLELAKVRDYHFFEISDKHRQIIFRALCPDFFDQLIIIAQGQQLIKGNKDLEGFFFRAYLKHYEDERAIKYITSFDKNYFEVLRHWIITLSLLKGAGIARKIYLEEIENLKLTERFENLVNKTDEFISGDFKKQIKQQEQYKKIRSVYYTLQKNGQSDYGFVNLYDIKRKFRLSYDSFNELLNLYYMAYRHKEIILFSNTVSSIDMRRRFLVGGNSVLKIRIIQKS